MLKKIALSAILMALIGGLVLILKQSQTPASNKQKLSIVCTTSMITDAVRIIGGNHVNIKGLMGPGVDPHLYKAREGDMHALRSEERRVGKECRL